MRLSIIRDFSYGVSAIGLMGLCAPAAIAQEATEVEASESSGIIVVTARKREERLLDIPESVAAISSESIER